MKCDQCGNTNMLPDGAQVNKLVGGINFLSRVPALRCSQCNWKWIEIQKLEQFELLVADALGERGVRTGEAFKFMRKAVGLSAAEVAELIDVTTTTISRWESGKWEPDKAAFAMLAALVHDVTEGRNDVRARLEALRSPPALPKRSLRLTVR